MRLGVLCKLANKILFPVVVVVVVVVLKHTFYPSQYQEKRRAWSH